MKITDFISPDSGGMLDRDDFTVLCGQVTTKNQNPILYLAYMARACGNILSYEYLVQKHASFCFLGPGRYIRRKCDPLRQSHDNVLAWAWWSVQLNIRYAKDIYDFAKWRFFVYDPHHFYSLDYRCILQGPTIFMLQLASDKKPGWLTTIWMAGAFIVQDHGSGAYLLSMLDTDILLAKQHLLSKYKKKLVFWSHDLMSRRRGKLSIWYKDYYAQQQDHPAIIAQRSNDEK